MEVLEKMFLTRLYIYAIHYRDRIINLSDLFT